MKAPFKPLSLAIAVATASAGYAGIVNAQTLADNTGLGDLAIIPYYTVNAGLSTGVSVINSSDRTQVVKIRLRRATDSMDALDFNVVMSPQDVWTGYIELADEDKIRFYSNDNSCTVPELGAAGYFEMPNIYRLGAEEGYIEVLGMGSPFNESQPIAVDAKHNDATGIPKDCTRVSDNFRKGTTPSDYYAVPPAPGSIGRTRGVINSATSWQWTSATNETARQSTYVDTGNVLKVSYFIKSDATGNEFGGDAVHIANFMSGPTITNQTVGINEGDLQGFDHPDLNGGAPTSVILGLTSPTVAVRGSYNPLRVALGATSVINDWSANDTDLFTVDTDWVVTTPGQYLMTNLSAYIDSLEVNGDECEASLTPAAVTNSEDSVNCDFRDIPLTVSAVVYDREEKGISVEEDDLVVSPQPPGVPQIVEFDREANVIQWGKVEVLSSDKNVIVPVPDGAEAGWAQVSVEPDSDKTQAICDYTSYGSLPMNVSCVATSTPVPLVGFVAWQRNFDDMPEANYGRIVDHSYTSN
jgi:hypothetical protein